MSYGMELPDSFKKFFSGDGLGAQDHGGTCADLHHNRAMDRSIGLVTGGGIDVDGGAGLGHTITAVDVAEDMDAGFDCGEPDPQLLTTQVLLAPHGIQDPVGRAMGDQDIGTQGDLIPYLPESFPLSGQVECPVHEPRLPG